EELAASVEIVRRLALIDERLLRHDRSLRDLWSRLQPLLAPPPEPPRRRIGFQREADAASPSAIRSVRHTARSRGSSRMSVKTTGSSPASHSAGVRPPA